MRDAERVPDEPMSKGDAGASAGGWYRDAVLYEVPVRAFRDGNADGIGDFIGLTEKLDYLRDLGVTALWVLPFYPSPLRDDGYDIADYRDVHADYGTLYDFRRFLDRAHRLGLRVVTELVLNHTSDRHAWFRRARHAEPGSPERDFYVWSDDAERYADTRVIFQDFETSNWTWDPVAGAYYWHRFYAHQPDLNFDNPDVHRELLEVVDFWLGMGVDGLRLDAVPYLYEREGTNCENLPETHAFLRGLRRHVDEHFPGRMLLAEANQWPEDAVEYFGDGDECHMAFHFPLMPRLFMGIRMEDRFPIEDILEQTPSIPQSAQWAIFLRNHDELTLEMVTDEERDYMYRVYASERRARINLGIRRRLAPLLSNDRKKIELMHGLLLSLPGSPVLYYGDEIGMGDNIYLGDRNGVRTPMHWSGDRNAGFSEANPQRLYLPVITDPEYRFEAVNVESQVHNASSLLWWVRRLVGLRGRHRAFGRGDLSLVGPDNPKVLAFVRRYEDEVLLVVANLSRFVQRAELDLAPWEGHAPLELFGHTLFPSIEDRPYSLTLGPHAFYWFQLQPSEETVGLRRGPEGGEAEVPGGAPRFVADAPPPAAPDWESLVEGEGARSLEPALARFLVRARWFGGKERRIRRVRIAGTVPLLAAEAAEPPPVFAVVEVEFDQGEDERYAVPLGFARGDRAAELRETFPEAVVSKARLGEDEGLVHEALVDPGVAQTLRELIEDERRLEGGAGVLVGRRFRAYERLRGEGAPPDGRLEGFEQSNSTIRYDDRFLLKLYRGLEEGVNPDIELSRFLDAREFPNVAPLGGAITLVGRGGTESAVGLLVGYVENRGDAWSLALEALGRFYERALADHDEGPEIGAFRSRTLLELADREASPRELEWIGPFLESARLLGRRTAELHRALASARGEEAYRPEPFSTLHQRALYQSARNLVGRTFRSLEDRLPRLPERAAERAARVRGLRDPILARFRELADRPIAGQRIRCHGDYHLGQVLNTGKDFVIIDFEGEPARPVGTRRIKRSPLVDVAGMLRSFHYAAHAGVREAESTGLAGAGDGARLSPWARFWSLRVGSSYLEAYREAAAGERFLPTDVGQLSWLLDLLLLEKAVYELGYELARRPDWVSIPVEGILDLMEDSGGA